MTYKTQYAISIHTNEQIGNGEYVSCIISKIYV